MQLELRRAEEESEGGSVIATIPVVKGPPLISGSGVQPDWLGYFVVLEEQRGGQRDAENGEHIIAYREISVAMELEWRKRQDGREARREAD